MSAVTTSSPSPAYFWLLLQRLGCPATLARRLHEMDPAADAGAWLAWPAQRWREARAPAGFLERLGEWLRDGPGSAPARQVAADLDWMAANRTTLLHLGHPGYPPLLLETADPPPWLYVQGDTACLVKPQLAVVGSRRPTQTGLADAAFFAGALAGDGFVITSGLAYGIDAAGHTAALAAGGCTVAVLGSGLDDLYPARHTRLARQIVEAGGAVISEFALGTPPRPTHFPSRNRIISGLSLGVLVVEAMQRSGSLVTARLALEQGREVFALPGSLHNPVSRGCNQLIRQGAVLVQEVADIVAELRGWMPVMRSPAPPAAPNLAPDEACVLAAVGFEPTPLEQVVERSARPLVDVLAALSELELAGLVENRAGAWLRRASR